MMQATESCLSPMRNSLLAHKFATLKWKPLPLRGVAMSAEVAVAQRTPAKLRKQSSDGPTHLWQNTSPWCQTRATVPMRNPLCPGAGRFLTGKSCLKPRAAALIIFPVSSQEGASQKEMVNPKRTWSRLLNHLWPPLFATHFAPGNC